MKIFPVPKNPNTNKADRAYTKRQRLLGAIGGAAVAVISFKTGAELQPLDGSRGYLSLSGIVGSVISVFSITAELQERYTKPRRDDDDGGGNWDPNAPPEPEPIFGAPLPAPDWFFEVEEYLQSQQLTPV